ncbi:MAG: hypothetical protein HN337_04640 [Deltaproteobacteria bacterium]|jgi:hypothetical protein|nr:hypothetical protein [Deltaproteobacteria bacterium]
MTSAASVSGNKVSIELFLLPQGPATFSEIDIQILHEVAKKCRDLLVQHL